MSGTPTRVAIVGGHGKIARLLLPLLIEQGMRVVSLARREEQREALAAAGAVARAIDIEADDAADFAAAFEGCDAVVFSAGAGADGNAARKQTVDLDGTLKTIAGAKAAGITRMVQVSAIGVDASPDPARGEVWAEYVRAKRESDAAVREFGLDWTILRPGSLLDEPPLGTVSLGPDVRRSSVPRADVAAVIAACLARPETAGHQWNLVSGDDPIAAAIDTALS